MVPTVRHHMLEAKKPLSVTGEGPRGEVSGRHGPLLSGILPSDSLNTFSDLKSDDVRYIELITDPAPHFFA